MLAELVDVTGISVVVVASAVFILDTYSEEGTVDDCADPDVDVNGLAVCVPGDEMSIVDVTGDKTVDVDSCGCDDNFIVCVVVCLDEDPKACEAVGPFVLEVVKATPVDVAVVSSVVVVSKSNFDVDNSCAAVTSVVWWPTCKVETFVPVFVVCDV